MYKLEIVTHGAREHVVEVEEYNVSELQDKLNDNEVSTIAIGDRIFSRIDIKYIGPFEETYTVTTGGGFNTDSSSGGGTSQSLSKK